MSTEASELGLFLGRFHPVLLHLPIGFMVLLGALEVLALFPRFRGALASARAVAALAVPASALTALCGWLLSRGGGYEAALLQVHQWTGFGLAAASALVCLACWRNWRRLYLLLLGATLVLLTVASHYGGSLTHGRGYLTRHLPGPLKSWLGGSGPESGTGPASGAGAADRPVFAAAIQPVLTAHCVSCHGPEKAKADLRLDSLAALQKGGESGPVLQPGQSGASLLVKRVSLPPSHEDHMPPEGRPQPTPDDLALLRWWIDAGAPADKKAGELNPPEPIRRLLKIEAGAAVAAPQPAAPQPLDKVLPLAQQLADELAISITPLGSSEPWLQCNASLASTNFGDADLARLSPLRGNLVWLDLAGTRVTESGLTVVAGMPRLRRLHLERTALTDAALAHLGHLQELEYLNLYGTKVTDAGLAQLKPLARLRQLYLWQTQVTAEGARAFGDSVMDKAQIQRWQEEIQALQQKISAQQRAIELGVPVTNAPALAGKPVNSKCPISGKDVDSAKTTLHEGKLVAFCCDNCKAQFEKDPKPHLEKLGLASPAQATAKP